MREETGNLAFPACTATALLEESGGEIFQVAKIPSQACCTNYDSSKIHRHMICC